MIQFPFFIGQNSLERVAAFPTSSSENLLWACQPESSPLFWQLVFMRYGTFRELIRQEDIEKRPAAHEKLMLIHQIYWKLTTEGPADLKLMFNWNHFFLVIEGLDSGKSPDAKERDTVDTSVARALSYLDDRISEWQDPYLVGNYAIAAIGAKRQEHIANARELLARLAHSEGSTMYWNLEANTTPFYGWGTAGRLETTALAVEALAKLETLASDPALAEQVNRGLQYLLNHKDRYACWYSTQATQNVIEAMIAATPVGKNGTGDETASVLVNDTKLADIKLPKPTEVVGPRVIDFGKELKAGSNGQQ